MFIFPLNYSFRFENASYHIAFLILLWHSASCVTTLFRYYNSFTYSITLPWCFPCYVFFYRPMLIFMIIVFLCLLSCHIGLKWCAFSVNPSDHSTAFSGDSGHLRISQPNQFICLRLILSISRVLWICWEVVSHWLPLSISSKTPSHRVEVYTIIRPSDASSLGNRIMIRKGLRQPPHSYWST